MHFGVIAQLLQPAANLNQVRRKLFTSLSKILPKSWTIHEETPMVRTGLRLLTGTVAGTVDPVPAACMLSAGHSLPDDHAPMVSVGRLQPGMILISQTSRKIGILGSCCPMDESCSQLHVALQRKLY
jgi:hypothetical protein